MRNKKRIFVFAAGWRTGSTLLQRIISSTDEVFMWGELHELGDVIVNSYSNYQKNLSKWHNNERFLNKVSCKIDNIEDANLNPPDTQLSLIHI